MLQLLVHHHAASHAPAYCTTHRTPLAACRTPHAARRHRYGLNVTTRFDVPSEHAWIVDAETCPNVEQTDLAKCCGDKGKVGTCQTEKAWPLPPASAAEVPIIACCGKCTDGVYNGYGPWWRQGNQCIVLR